MKTRIAAIVLAAVLTAPAFAAEPAQASEEAVTFCKLSATIIHDAVLARLNGEKREQAEKRLTERFMPAAKHEKAREIVRETVQAQTAAAYKTELLPGLKKSDYKYIAEEVGKGDFKLCMEAAMSN